ncbi:MULTISPECIES: hypothetical protein [Streptomyces]|uniref:Uncharacterized protein n=1 Tax=Streptomyces violaceoruber TaxID=1935 RepID=A0ACD4WE18_STRVN|nr:MULTISPECIES: hypothetical protein [unclassified Streptomyces]MDX3371679.1 hypothetical protein [Streptomyces sp. ME02-6987-2C]MDX3426751.1 hypothetical protein [Streptomyces sp. ME02-6985-2c]WOY95975.1 hypothetical protein R2E43_00360 [Streptomyces violaceoruber]
MTAGRSRRAGAGGAPGDAIAAPTRSAPALFSPLTQLTGDVRAAHLEGRSVAALARDHPTRA